MVLHPRKTNGWIPKMTPKVDGRYPFESPSFLERLDFWGVDWIDPFEDVPNSWQKARKIVLHFGKCSSLDGCHFFIFSTV